MYTLSASKRFQKQFKKLSSRNPKLKIRMSKTMLLMIKNPKHPSLRLHKLSGNNTWSISVSKSIRMIIGIKRKKVYLLRVGIHDEVY